MDLKERARQLYEARQARCEHPAGSYDRQGRWYPNEGEEQECGKAIRSPSRAWPHSLMMHCRSLKHCRNLVEAQIREKEVIRNGRQVR